LEVYESASSRTWRIWAISSRLQVPTGRVTRCAARCAGWVEAKRNGSRQAGDGERATQGGRRQEVRNHFANDWEAGGETSAGCAEICAQ